MDTVILRAEFQSTWRFFLRPLQILRGYQRSNLRPDLIAGLTIAVILLPQAMAYALIAELPSQVGLYTAIVGGIVGAMWGSSNQLQTGPTNAASLLVLSVLIPIAAPGSQEYLLAAGFLALLAGLIRLGMGLARLGMLVNFVSDSVITGFTAGAGLLIFFNQLRHMLGLHFPSSSSLSDTLQSLAIHLHETHSASLAMGLVSILIISVLKRLNSRAPGPLIAIVFASVLTAFLGLNELGVQVVGELPRGLPPFSHLPILDLKLVSQLISGALALAAIGLIQATSIARSLASQTGQRLDSNQEFVGQGLANIACALLSGYECSGSFIRSAVNLQAGARTPLSNVFSGTIVFIIVLVFGWMAVYIPLPALAGVVLVMAVGLIDTREMARIWRGTLGDRVVMVVTLLAMLMLPLQFAVLSGILMSLAYYLLQTSTPRVRPVIPNSNFGRLIYQPDKPACPQLGIIEILGDLYFGAVYHIEEAILANRVSYPEQRYLLLRISSVNHCDISGIHALEGVLRSYREDGGDIYVSRYQAPVMDIMHTTGFYETLGADHFLGREKNAIEHLFYRVLDPAICIYECPNRVFMECQNLPKRLDLIGGPLHLELNDKDVSSITAKELWEAIHDPYPIMVVDVREPREYRRGHIPHASSMPLPELMIDLDQLPRNYPIALICRGGRRSTRLACMLRDRGYDNIQILKGGMLAWEAANLLEAIDENPAAL